MIKEVWNGQGHRRNQKGKKRREENGRSEREREGEKG